MLAYLLRVLPYVRPYWRLGAFSIWLTIGAAVVWPAGAVAAQGPGRQRHWSGAVARWCRERPRRTRIDRFLLLALTVVAGLVIAIIGGAVHVLNSYVNTKLEQRMIADFRGDLFRHTERLSVATTIRSAPGD